MESNYTSPLARWARVLEIFIPCYMFGKAWGIANENTVGLFRAGFPPFLIDAAEDLKSLVATDNANLGRLVATSAGALVGFGVVAVLAVAMHFVMRDRKYVDSLRFTSVTLIPLAVLNGTLSHAVAKLVEDLGAQSTEALTKSALEGPRGFVVMFAIFYVTSLWIMGRRTGVTRKRRFALVGVGMGFLAMYIAFGLMITPSEWAELLPVLQAAHGQ